MKLWHLGAIVFAGAVLLPVSCSVGYYKLTQNTFDATINQVNRTSRGGTEVLLAQDPYDWGTIKNDDNWAILKFNSGVMSGKLFSGAHCTLTTYGWRNTVLSWKPNLIKVENCKK